MRITLCVVSVASAALFCACSTMSERTDRGVYHLIGERQLAALGETHDAKIDTPLGDEDTNARMYRFNPRPLDPGIPTSFATKPSVPPSPPTEDEDESNADAAAQPTDNLSANIFGDSTNKQVSVFALSDALASAMTHARDFQDAKEDLYLAALDLTLERHLWTPQFVASLQATYDDVKDDVKIDRALSTVGDVAVTQRLPFGGEIGARMIHDLVRDVRDRVGRAESGQVILDARVPLLRGAGRVAYESRYLMERRLIYAIRDFERFRRAFLVDVAQEYFSLQQSKAAINNFYKTYLSQKQESEKADFQYSMARIDIFQASRAKSSFRRAAASLVSAKERYETALDRFKIRIGMDVGELLDVVDQELDESSKAVDALLPNVTVKEAVEVALKLRLDLLNSADQWDDARRGVVIAKNAVLPDLDLGTSVHFGSDPNRLRGTEFNDDRRTWQGTIQLRMDDRRSEQNAYRESQIRLRRAQRSHEEFSDIVRADTRRALRRIAQQDSLRQIEAISVSENELRLEAAIAHFSLGKKTNQDVVDAENALLTARNALAAAVAAYRASILVFRRDTGTLRVTDDGDWEDPAAFGNQADEPSGTDDGG